MVLWNSTLPPPDGMRPLPSYASSQTKGRAPYRRKYFGPLVVV